MAADRVTLKDLAADLNVSRSWMLRKCRKDGTELVEESRRASNGAVHVSLTVSASDANSYRRRYAKARKNAEPATATS